MRFAWASRSVHNSEICRLPGGGALRRRRASAPYPEPWTLRIPLEGDVLRRATEGEIYAVVAVSDRTEAEGLVADGTVDAAVLSDSASPTGVLVIADESAPADLVALMSVTPTVELLNPDAPSFGTRYILGLIFGLVFMMAAITFGSPIATSVVEEKQTRVIEILLSAIPARALLAGKVVGNTLLAIGQILVLALVVVVALLATGQVDVLEGIGAPILWFAVFFPFGFLLIASMFAAAGALVSRQEDAGATYTPVLFLIMIPVYLVLFLGGQTTVMVVLSYVPFSSPVAMPIRLFFGEAAWWEPLAALGLMLIAVVLVVLIGARIYENSLLKMGARVKLRDALRGR